MDLPEFPIEYHVEIPLLPVELQEEVEERLLKLAGDDKDMTGAAIAITEPAQGELPYSYQARIVVYMRPDNVVAIEKSGTLEGAIKGAASAIERQVREKRKKLRETWKRTDIPGTPGSFPDQE